MEARGRAMSPGIFKQKNPGILCGFPPKGKAFAGDKKISKKVVLFWLTKTAELAIIIKQSLLRSKFASVLELVDRHV